jgi:hypothetical protein
VSNEGFLDRASILGAFQRLAQRLEERDLVCDIYLFGGGAMVIAFDSREATSDLDARFTSTSKVQREIDQVARELGFPRWWLNEQGTAYLPDGDDPVGVFDHPNLRVMRTSDRHLLAMKVRAARRHADVGDIKLLAGRLGLRTMDEVETLCDEVFPEEPLSVRQRAVAGEALAT